jgi:predicted nuclease of predicted toxin-antitoxin system
LGASNRLKILIDNNVKQSVHIILAQYDFVAETAMFHGLADLSNGELTKAAFALGFRCILTQDKSFIREAAHVLSALPEMALILIDTSKLKQTPRETYLDRFKSALENERLNPVAGKLILWPSR